MRARTPLHNFCLFLYRCSNLVHKNRLDGANGAKAFIYGHLQGAYL